MKLSEQEVHWRQEWRNIKVLYEKSQAQNAKLKKRIKEQDLRIQELEKENKELRAVIEKQALQIEELQQMVFGRRKKKKPEDEDEDDTDEPPDTPSLEKKTRNKDSYRREKPKPEDVTETKRYEIDACPDCGEKLKKKKIIIFWEEDIPLPLVDGEKGTLVVEHHTQKGYCPNCKKWHSAKEIPPKKVILGKKVKFFICYLNILLRMSYSQIRSFLHDTYHFQISDGEITKIMEQSGRRLRSEFERIKESLQKSKGVHLDETTWRNLYLWVMTGVENDDVLYLAGKTRGNGNIDDLLGEEFRGVRVSDAYSAYKKKPGEGQQCWAHPHRKLRDLAASKQLSKTKKKHCQKAYTEFSEIYRDLREMLKNPFEKNQRAEQKQKLQTRISSFRAPHPEDPEKLKNIRKQFFTYEKEWLTCLDHEEIPCDNNKAERMLRHFIIKRKISFGTKNEKSSETFQILASVFMSFWKRSANSQNFFPSLFPLFVGER